MKFLCVPCDSPMTLRTVSPPEEGSLSVVYTCPECGYEMAMLTNAYETQVVQSLGVRIGPAEAPALAGAKAGGCPFSGMIQAAGAERAATGEAPAFASSSASAAGEASARLVTWTAAAEARLARVPGFVRPMAKTGIEQFARDRGVLEVDEAILDEAREFFGM